MLTSLYEALFAHLSRLAIPVYQADCVPEGAALPYVTARVSAPLIPGGSGSLTLTVWVHGNEANALRLARTDSLYALLPPRGAFLQAETGSMLLRLDHPALCVHKPPLLGLQSTWTLRFYPAM